MLVEMDNPNGLAEGILSIWKNPALAEELGRQGYSRVREHYSLARMVDRALEVYAELRNAAGERDRASAVALA